MFSRKLWVLPAAACALLLGSLITSTAAASAARKQTGQRAPLASRLSRLHSVRQRRGPSARPLHRLVPAPSRRSRIIGGYGGLQSDWPFMAFVAYFDTSRNLVFNCTGTDVAPNVVLTAGHCGVDETTGATLDPAGFAVVTGSVDWTGTAQRQVSPVSRVIVNPAYNPVTDTFDAGLLVLSTPTSAPAIPLATSADGYLTQARTPAYIAGWGDTYYGDPSVQTTLQWASTVVQSASYCSQFDPNFSSSSELCAVNPPDYLTATCYGDSGGPLGAYSANGQLVEIGITTHVPAE